MVAPAAAGVFAGRGAVVSRAVPPVAPDSPPDGARLFLSGRKSIPGVSFAVRADVQPGLPSQLVLAGGIYPVSQYRKPCVAAGRGESAARLYALLRLAAGRR